MREMRGNAPSRRQAEMLEIILRAIELEGQAPSVRDLAAAMGLASANAQQYRSRLVAKGLLVVPSRRPRIMSLTRQGLRSLGAGCLLDVAAELRRRAGLLEALAADLPVVPADALPSPRQRDVLEAIEALRLEAGFGPGVVEIGDRIGVTSNATFGHLRALERKGLIRGAGHTVRGIALTDRGLVALGPQALQRAIGDLAARAARLDAVACAGEEVDHA